MGWPEVKCWQGWGSATVLRLGGLQTNASKALGQRGISYSILTATRETAAHSVSRGGWTATPMHRTQILRSSRKTKPFALLVRTLSVRERAACSRPAHAHGHLPGGAARRRRQRAAWRLPTRLGSTRSPARCGSRGSGRVSSCDACARSEITDITEERSRVDDVCQ